MRYASRSECISCLHMPVMIVCTYDVSCFTGMYNLTVVGSVMVLGASAALVIALQKHQHHERCI